MSILLFWKKLLLSAGVEAKQDEGKDLPLHVRKPWKLNKKKKPASQVQRLAKKVVSEKVNFPNDLMR